MHTQLNYTVKPEVMFKNYQYVSGTSCTLREYCFHFTQKCIKDTEYTGGTVLELACNDGSQLDEFRKLGWDTYGVDPAQNIIIEGQQKGHKVCCGFWGHDNFPLIPTPDIIIAQNVFAHVPDPIQFMNHCARVMKDHTYLYIQTSQCNMYQNGEFDTIYHEHLSFFTIASMMKAVEICDLIITEITKQPIHGTSYLFQIRKRSSIITKHSEQALKMYREEADIGLYTDQFYEDYNRKVVNIKEWVFSKITEFKQKNIPFVGYGAAAKGMTLLNFFDIQNLEYIADDAILKHNKYTPGKNIRIVPPSWLGKDKRELVVFVFAWNFMKEILQKITLLRKGLSTYIIQPFPEQIVYHIQCDGTIHIL
jgi:2-polyprenyl-3-methyl-5-hydroxy-6-metoxy-1,4-benzoquinol methylase